MNVRKRLSRSTCWKVGLARTRSSCWRISFSGNSFELTSAGFVIGRKPDDTLRYGYGKNRLPALRPRHNARRVAVSRMPAAARATHARWVPVLALIAFGTMLNYLDRTVLGIAAPSLTKDLGLTAPMMGVAFSAFSWSYALLQIPGGIFLDRAGTRLTYFIALVGWSACTAAMGIVGSL